MSTINLTTETVIGLAAGDTLVLPSNQESQVSVSVVGGSATLNGKVNGTEGNHSLAAGNYVLSNSGGQGASWFLLDGSSSNSNIPSGDNSLLYLDSSGDLATTDNLQYTNDNQLIFKLNGNVLGGSLTIRGTDPTGTSDGPASIELGPQSRSLGDPGNWQIYTSAAPDENLYFNNGGGTGHVEFSGNINTPNNSPNNIHDVIDKGYADERYFIKYQGTATLSSGTVTITPTFSTSISSGSRFQFTHKGTGTVGNFGTLYLGTVVDNTSFQIKSTNGSDNDEVFWVMTTSSPDP